MDSPRAMSIGSITTMDAVHADLVKRIDTITASHPVGKVPTLLHLGCGVPLFIAGLESFRSRCLAYLGLDEDSSLVAAASERLPSLRFVWRELDSMLCMEADIILLGPGIFRMCGGGMEQLMHNLTKAGWSHLFSATVPSYANSLRETLITFPRTHVPADVADLVPQGFCHPVGLVGHARLPFSYFEWSRP